VSYRIPGHNLSLPIYNCNSHGNINNITAIIHLYLVFFNNTFIFRIEGELGEVSVGFYAEDESVVKENEIKVYNSSDVVDIPMRVTVIYR
jgi:hypothetical protein